MKKIVFAACLIFPMLAFGQVLSPGQLQADFDRMRSALEEAHGGLYRHVPKQQMDRYFDQSREGLNRPMSQWAFYGHLSELLAKIGDGHLRIDYDQAELTKRPRPLFFPYDILMEGKVATIKTNDSKTDTLIRPGMQLLSVNGHRVSELQKKFFPKVLSDGQNISRKERRMERNFGAYYWSFIDTASSFTVEARGRSGRVTANVQGIPNTERIANRNMNPANKTVLPLLKKVEPPQDNISVQFFEGNIAHLRIGLFAGPKFEKELDSVFRVIRQKNSPGLIVDLRSNMGGLDHLGAYLIGKLVTRPFRYLDHIHARVLVPSFASWKEKPPVDLVNGTIPAPQGGYLLKPQLNSCIAEQKASADPYTGKLVVLISGTTFSAASDVSSLLKHLTNGIFVGEETGGGQQGNTSALDAILKLPNSTFNVRIHLWDFWTAVPVPKQKGRGTFPDHAVVRRSAEWLNGVDTQLNYAIALLK